MPERFYDRTPALAIMRTLRSTCIKQLPYLKRRSNDPDVNDMIDLVEEIIRRTERWKKKANPKVRSRIK